MNGSSHHAGGLFLNEQLEARSDGLCPSLLSKEYSSAADAKRGNGRSSISTPAPMTKTYETHSKYLNQAIRQKKDTSLEVGFISKSVTSALNNLVDEEGNLTPFCKLDFVASGCSWTLEFNPETEFSGFQIQVTCLARETDDGDTTYIVDTHLYDKQKEMIMATTVANDEASAYFEAVAYEVRQAVVKCEFPTFPESGHGRLFKEVYKLNKKLKSGVNTTICQGVHRESGDHVVVKCVNRSELKPADEAAVIDEVAIMAFLSHPCIVPIVDFFEEEDTYYIVKERLDGGDLLERIGILGEEYSEGDARDIVRNLLKAVVHCHSHNIAHRDINSKNILLVNDESNTEIKLAGFGFAARCHAPKSLTRLCGTPFFAAPEILTRKPYDQEADVWAIGCFAFLLLSGTLPFKGTNQRDLFRNIVMGKFEIDEDDWEGVSDDAKTFVKKLLVLNPEKRLTAEAASKLLWMQVSYKFLSKNKLGDTAERIKIFHERMTSQGS